MSLTALLPSCQGRMTELPLGLDVNPRTHRKTCKNPPRNPQNRKKPKSLLHNCSITTCTTNSERIEVMELEGYSRPTCNKLCSSGHDSSIVVGVIYKLDRRRVSSTTRPTCRGIIFQVQSLRQTSRGKYLWFLRYSDFLTTQCTIWYEMSF